MRALRPTSHRARLTAQGRTPTGDSKIARVSALVCALGIAGTGCGADQGEPPQGGSGSASNGPDPSSASDSGAETSSPGSTCYDAQGHAPGSVDESFANNGVQIVGLSPLAGTPAALSMFQMLSDGRLLGAGYTTSARSAFVFMLDANGHRIHDFGEDGFVDFVFAESGQSKALGAAIDAQDRILLAGTDATAAVLARLTADGAKDPTFGTDGIVAVSQGEGVDEFARVIPRADGTIVVAGQSLQDGQWTPTLTFFDDRGRRDSAIGADGVIAVRPTNASASIRELAAIDEQSWLLVGESDGDLFWATVDSTGAQSVILEKERTALTSRGVVQILELRRESDGSISSIVDTSLNGFTSGVAAFDSALNELWHTDRTFIEIRSATAACDGRIVAVGRRFLSRDPAGPGVLVRFEANGSIDPSLGGSEGLDYWRESPTNGGQLTTSFQSVHIQPDGRIIAAGISDGSVEVVRFWP